MTEWVLKVAARRRERLRTTGENPLAGSGPGSEPSVFHRRGHGFPRLPHDDLRWIDGGQTKVRSVPFPEIEKPAPVLRGPGPSNGTR